MRIPSTPIEKIAAIVHAEFNAPTKHMVTGFNEIHRVQPGDCAFVDHPKYYDKALQSEATTVIINKKVDCPPGKAIIIHSDPFAAFNALTRHFSQRTKGEKHRELPVIAPSAVIMPGAFIGKDVIIGNNTVIHPNVTIYDHCTIGNNVTIHAGATVGSDAFYFKKRENGYETLFSCGTVVIEDNVIIGANCTIDRGVTDVTRIGKGSVLDNLVHVGHDVLIGERCLFAAQVGIAGATTIGHGVTMWGQVGISSGLTIGDGATILAQSGVAENVPEGATWFGTPAGSSREKMKEVFALKQLPHLIRKLYGG